MVSIISLAIFIGTYFIFKGLKKPDLLKDPDAEERWRKLLNQIEFWRNEKRTFLLAHNVNIIEHDHVLKDTQSGKFGGDEKECPKCAESVKARAKVCRYCNFEFLEV